LTDSRGQWNRPLREDLTSLQRDSDRLLDTILALHQQEPLDVVFLRVDPGFALGLIRAQRPGPDQSRFTTSHAEPDDVIASFRRAQVLRHCDPDGTARDQTSPAVPASRRQGGGPPVSVIIPVHNLTRHLGEAVASVRTGHGIQIEPIVVEWPNQVAKQAIS